MKLSVELEAPAWVKRIARYAIPVVAIVVSGAALATPQVMFTAGDTLKAADLNANFTDLYAGAADVDARVTSLEAVPTFLTAVGTVGATSTLGADLTYQGMSLDLTPGTWRIDANVTLTTTTSQADSVQIALWNDTTMAEVPDSRSAGASTGSVGTCNPGGCLAVPLVTSTVVTVAGPTKLRIRAIRNGSSQVSVVPPGGLSGVNRMTALKLR